MSLDRAWSECFDLAWEAFRTGNIPVGAVVVGPDGEVVSRGRNRIFDDDTPPGQLAGGYLAHAEVNALLGLDAERHWDDHTLLSALEPCFLCMGAAWMSMIGGVSFAARDFFGGAARQLGENVFTKGRVLRVEGPRDDDESRLVATLQLVFFLEALPEGRVVTSARTLAPETLRDAERLRDGGVADGERFADALRLYRRL